MNYRNQSIYMQFTFYYAIPPTTDLGRAKGMFQLARAARLADLLGSADSA